MSQQANQQQLVVFTLGAEHYGLPIHAVNEIIRYSEPRSVASRTEWVRGVISLRGRIVIVSVTADRVKDAVETPFSTGVGTAPPLRGIAVHAHLADQLIREAYGEPALTGLSRGFEAVWIWAWALAGGCGRTCECAARPARSTFRS